MCRWIDGFFRPSIQRSPFSRQSRLKSPGFMVCNALVFISPKRTKRPSPPREVQHIVGETQEDHEANGEQRR